MAAITKVTLHGCHHWDHIAWLPSLRSHCMAAITKVTLHGGHHWNHIAWLPSLRSHYMASITGATLHCGGVWTGILLRHKKTGRQNPGAKNSERWRKSATNVSEHNRMSYCRRCQVRSHRFLDWLCILLWRILQDAGAGRRRPGLDLTSEILDFGHWNQIFYFISTYFVACHLLVFICDLSYLLFQWVMLLGVITSALVIHFLKPYWIKFDFLRDNSFSLGRIFGCQ